jgi:hypothetical protein
VKKPSKKDLLRGYLTNEPELLLAKDKKLKKTKKKSHQMFDV